MKTVSFQSWFLCLDGSFHGSKYVKQSCLGFQLLRLRHLYTWTSLDSRWFGNWHVDGSTVKSVIHLANRGVYKWFARQIFGAPPFFPRHCTAEGGVVTIFAANSGETGTFQNIWKPKSKSKVVWTVQIHCMYNIHINIFIYACMYFILVISSLVFTLSCFFSPNPQSWSNSSSTLEPLD